MVHQEHILSRKLSADALDRFSDTGDPYAGLVADGNFRSALLKALDGNMIISGAVLEEVQKLNGNGPRRMRDRARAYALPVIGGGGVGTLLLIKAIELVRLL